MLRLLRNTAAVRLYSTASRSSAEVTDATTFLTRIGRNMVEHAEHFETLDSLTNTTSKYMKDKGIDTRDRRYILGWIEKYKQNFELVEIRRGHKKWGGERNRRANRAAFYGRKAAEEREKSS